jgi:uncharacterized HAD superfamily protein
MAPKTPNHDHATTFWDFDDNSQYCSLSLTRPQHEEEEKQQVFVFEFPWEWQEASKYSVDKVIRRETDMSSVTSGSDLDDSSYTTSTTTDMMIAAGILVDPEDPLLVSEVEEEGLVLADLSTLHCATV